MRNAFVNTLIDLARKDKRVALLMAEVGFSVVEPFEKEFPDRFFNTGIAEQSLVLTAAGMAAAGMRPVAYSMSCFLPSRAYEIIKVSVCYQNLPVALVSVGTGLSYGEMGATHHAIEESAIMRSLPNMTVMFPATPDELRGALEYALTIDGPSYTSFQKAPVPDLPASTFQPGRAVKYRDGKDGAILAAGHMAAGALDASKLLEGKGLSLAVYGFHTVKPLDERAIIEACQTRNIFVVDEHQRCAGLAGEIASVILKAGVKIDRFMEFCIPDEFINNVMTYNGMLEHYGLDAKSIASGIAGAMLE